MVAMNISLTPELAKIIRDKVKSGLYSNASEVVREAVRSLNSQDAVRNLKAAQLRKLLAPSLREADEGIYAEYSLEKIRKKLNKKSKNA